MMSSRGFYLKNASRYSPFAAAAVQQRTFDGSGQGVTKLSECSGNGAAGWVACPKFRPATKVDVSRLPDGRDAKTPPFVYQIGERPLSMLPVPALQ